MAMPGERIGVQATRTTVRCLRVAGIGPARFVLHYAEHRLPSGILVPSPTSLNVRDEAAFVRILATVAGPRPPRRLRLALPDSSVRLHALATDPALGGSAQARRSLLWQLQHLFPFAPRETRLVFCAAADGFPDRRATVVLAAREQVLAQYEQLLDAIGSRVAHVAPAAWHLFQGGLARPGAARSGVSGFVAVEPDAATFILSHQGIPRYVRTSGLPRAGDLDPAVATRQLPGALAGMVSASILHARETVGLAPPSGIVLAGEVPGDERFAGALASDLGIPCTPPLPAARPRWASKLPQEAHALIAAVSAHL